MAKLFANSGDPDQTPRSAASDLGLHCLLITLLRVSRLQWVKQISLQDTIISFCYFIHIIHDSRKGTLFFIKKSNDTVIDLITIYTIISAQ